MVEKFQFSKQEAQEIFGDKVVIEPVSIDLFLGGINDSLSKEVVQNNEFQTQSEERRHLYRLLDKFFTPNLRS